MESIQDSVGSLQRLSVEEPTKMLRSRIEEQSSLIYSLKHKVDEQFLRCQVLQKANAELEEQVTACLKELDGQRKKAELLEKTLVDLADGRRSLSEEYSDQNVQLKMENRHLQTENETLLSQKLQDKEFIQKLMDEIKLLTEKCTNKEKEYHNFFEDHAYYLYIYYIYVCLREKAAAFKSELLENVSELQAKETSLLDQLQHSREQQKDADETCKNLKLKLQKTEREIDLKEISITSITKQKDKLFDVCMEKEALIQEKEEEIQQMERDLKEERKSRVEAQDRFQQEAEAVNANVKVNSLKSALDESIIKCANLEKEFKAFREHSAKLLRQERELNEKLRHMMG
ncbi:coiled-coil domain-containing protein 89 [Antennarius striatus]|uniref:coiled-coil domain-containing protein 89 n=1 Tax=Antennarius striatus TaxID=241820 RepID=UPI0035B4E11A